MSDEEDLVQRLRSNLWIEQTDLTREAADRIEELEKIMWQMHGEAHEHIKRIEELEAKLADNPRRTPEEKIKGYGEIARDSVGKK